jgi:hypothetical protein
VADVIAAGDLAHGFVAVIAATDRLTLLVFGEFRSACGPNLTPRALARFGDLGRSDWVCCRQPLTFFVQVGGQRRAWCSRTGSPRSTSLALHLGRATAKIAYSEGGIWLDGANNSASLAGLQR